MSLPDQMTDRWENAPEPPPGEGRRVLAHAVARLPRGRGLGPPGSAAASWIRRPGHDPAGMVARDHAAGRAGQAKTYQVKQVLAGHRDYLQLRGERE